MCVFSYDSIRVLKPLHMCPHTQPLNTDLLFLFNPLNLRETPALFKKNSLHFFNFFFVLKDVGARRAAAASSGGGGDRRAEAAGGRGQATQEAYPGRSCPA